MSPHSLVLGAGLHRWTRHAAIALENLVLSFLGDATLKFLQVSKVCGRIGVCDTGRQPLRQYVSEHLGHGVQGTR